VVQARAQVGTASAGRFVISCISCRMMRRFLGRRVVAVETRAALPASETRQGTRSRGRFAEGSGLEGSGFRLRYGELAPPGRAAGSAARPKRAGLTRLRAGCDR